MTNLKEGQRIDVYEVVVDEVYGTNGTCIKGDHFISDIRRSNKGSVGIWIMDKIAFTDHANPLVCFKNEVRKCGYYLKVKSLKGGEP